MTQNIAAERHSLVIAVGHLPTHQARAKVQVTLLAAADHLRSSWWGAVSYNELFSLAKP